MDRAPAWRTIGLLFFLFVGVSACVDTAEPTGPVPTPEPEPGELTSVVRPADGPASAASRPGSRSPTSASTDGS